MILIGVGSTGGCVKTLEKLEVTPASGIWEKVVLAENKAAETQGAALFQFSSDEIVIFKGNGNPDTYMFDKKANKIVSNPAKVQADSFINCQYYINGSIWTFGRNAHAHKYDPLEKDVSKRYTPYPFDTIKK